jgi:deoxyribodipyrimidine photolyase-related protein
MPSRRLGGLGAATLTRAGRASLILSFFRGTPALTISQSNSVPMSNPPLRNLVVVLGDQLDHESAAFDGFDPRVDRVWMCEARDESEATWSSLQRIAVFLAAMRHFAESLRARGWTVDYRTTDGSIDQALQADLIGSTPTSVVWVEPGEWRLREALRAACSAAGVAVSERTDRHFLCSLSEFVRHAQGRKQLRLEYFYRELRTRHRVLMVDAETGEPASATTRKLEPAGGQWNFDEANREAFPATGPGAVPAPLRFDPDPLTRAVIDEVRARYSDHPGQLDEFGWPVQREQALGVLADFIDHRLPQFGRWQDAMWAGEPWLWHSHLSVALNLKLISPREVIAAAEAAWWSGRAPIAAVEGFVRQILGWREYVRGIYWLKMPDYLEMNALQASEPLPGWYWTGDTPMACVRNALGQTLRLGYAHHIQRLMVTGLYALLYGVDPKAVHRWYLAVYVDAIEWVELPNTLGMSQYADGGLMASKPYAATGKYIERMSNHCGHCPFRPDRRTGSQACPFTTLYWDFLLRHEARFAEHPRMALQVKNLKRIDESERAAIRERIAQLRQMPGVGHAA